MAVEIGGAAVERVYKTQTLNVKVKSLTAEGKEELLTKADLISNHLIMQLFKKFPLLKVRLIPQIFALNFH